MKPEKKVRVLVLIIIFLILYSFASFGVEQGEAQGIALRIALDGDPIHLDQAQPAGWNSWVISSQLCEGFFRYRADGTREKAGITNFEISPDGLTYTLNLRSDAIWSDGVPVVAQHYLDALSLVETAASQYLLDPISTTQAPSSTTLEIVLDTPHAHFVDALATQVIMCPIRLDIPEENRPFVTNGPFVLDEWVPDVYLRLVKNDQYWGEAQVQFDEILFSIIPNPAQQLLAYRNGELDVAGIPSAEYPNVISDPVLAPDVREIVRPGLRYLGFNVIQAPMDDMDLRAALTLSVDRGALLGAVGTTAWQERMTGVIPPSMPGHQGGSVGYSYDSAVAQARLGYYLTTHGGSASDIDIELWTYTSTVAEEIADMWRTVLGINVNVVTIPFNDYLDRLGVCRFNPSDPSCTHHAYYLGWAVDYFDGWNLLYDLFHPDSSRNHTQWDSLEYRDFLISAATATDEPSRIAYYQQAEEILVETDLAVVPLFTIDQVVLIKSNIYYEYPTTGLPPSYMYWSINPLVVTNTNDTGPGSLRQSILDANAISGKDVIAFNIPASDPGCNVEGECTIKPGTALPAITDPVLIDGYTQSGASPNTNGPSLGNNAVLKIELDGSQAGVSSGLNIFAGASTVQGLVINRFGMDGIRLYANGGNIIRGNYIGSDITGAVDLGNSFRGVFILDVPNNTIGGVAAGDANIISGNSNNGVEIFGNGATENLVQGNFIGTDANGTLSLGNSQRGVLINEAPNNVIGGTTEGARNVISANNLEGIYIHGTGAYGNEVRGNYIGTDLNGTAPLGNSANGVFISNGASNNTIGGPMPGAGNVISGNDNGGVGISEVGTTQNVVQGNFIGTDVTGVADLGNANNGISVWFGATDNLIGGSEPGAGNVISGNDGGVGISEIGTTQNLVQGNLIGTDVTGTNPLGNTSTGIFVTDGPTDNVIAGNVISDNGSSGVVLDGPGVMRNVVAGNFIGTDIGGTAALPNFLTGVWIVDGAADNTIGGTTPEERNVISGNDGTGISIVVEEPDFLAPSGNRIQGNFIGTDVTGTLDLGNTRAGILIVEAFDNVVGGVVFGARNVISGNDRSGVVITGSGATGNLVQGNYIGTDATGTLAVGNGIFGVAIFDAANNKVGGTVVGEGNLISANGESGVLLMESGTTANTVQGNLIGTDANGVQPLGNTLSGVEIRNGAFNNTVGGAAPEAGNLLSGNGDNGVALHNGANDNLLRGNTIGADVSGSLPLGNDGNGVWVSESSGNKILGNHVSHNLGNGVLVEGETAVHNTITRNSIHDNAYQGIENLDRGNMELSPPTITAMLGDRIEGTALLNSRVEIFADVDGEGRTYLGFTVTDPGGSFNYDQNLTGPNLTATATDGMGNTSEFSEAVFWAPDNCEFNDAYEEACDVATELDFSMTSEGSFSSYISRPDDVDWFFINFPDSVTPGDFITISLSGTGEDEQLPANYDLVVLAELDVDPNAVPAPLQGVPLQGVPLQGVPLQGVPLQGVDAQSIPLQGVPLQGVDTNSIPLQGVPLQGVPLQGVPLQGVPLQGVPLQGVPLQGVPLQGVGFHQGRSPEVVSTLYRGGMTGRFYVLVWSSTGEYSLDPEQGAYEVTVGTEDVSVEPCSTGLDRGLLGDSLAAPLGNTDAPTTLILIHRPRTVALYGEERANSLLDVLAGDSIENLVEHSLVNGLVVDLGDPSFFIGEQAATDLEDAYAAWDTEGCSSETANLVTLEIKKVILGVIDQYSGSIQNLVLVGNDKVIPFRRVPDETVRTPDGATVPNEFDYQNEYEWEGELIRAVGETRTNYSPTFATLRLQYFLSDDFYADMAPVLLEHGHELSVPDMPTGRLVETPEDIQGYIGAFLSLDGMIGEEGAATSITTLTTGYSFLIDQAQAIDEVFGEKGIEQREFLISDDWDHIQFSNRYTNLPQTPHVSSINAHFDHWQLASAVYPQDDLITSIELASEAVDQAGTVIFSVGCHVGLNFPDGDSFNESEPGAFDFSQALLGRGVTLIGNWGFGYGDDAALAYSEELMLNFARQLGEVSVGRALVDAKREYLLTQALMDPVHEKILMEAVYYGLPMWELNAEVTSLPAGVTASFEQETQNDLVVRDYAVDINAQERIAVTTSRGTYYKLAEQTQAGLFRPVQPKASLDIGGETGKVAHGVLFVGGTYFDVFGVDPVITMPTWTRTVPELHYIYEGWDPARFWSLAQLENGDGTYEERLVVVPGQFLVDVPATIASGGTIGTERLHDSLGFQVYYAPASAEFQPPIIGLVTAEVIDNQGIWIKVEVEDPPDIHGDSSGIVRVIVIYTSTENGTSWQGVDLALNPNTARWEGILANVEPIDFFIQALDGSGNVGMFAGNGYFTPVDVSVDGPSTVVVGQPVSFTSAHPLEEPAILWEFGDGALAEGSDSVDHTFSESGEPVVLVRVVDSEGNIGETLFNVLVVDDLLDLDDTLFRALEDLREYFGDPNRLPDNAISGKAENRRKTLLNKINAVVAIIGDEGYGEAIDKLNNDLRAKMDGCMPEADKNDWITNCVHQFDLRARIDGIIALLEEY